MADTRGRPRRPSSTPSRTSTAYQAARDGINRFGYTSFQQYFGLPQLEYTTNQFGLFVQDDWRVTPDLKVLYGVRYDYYGVPEGRAERADRDVERVPDVQEQLRPAPWRSVDAR